MKARLFVSSVLLIVLIVGLVLILSGRCGTSTSRPSGGGRFVHVSGRNPDTGALEVQIVNLWKDYDNRGAGIAGQARHGERVRLIARSGRGVLIETTSGARGWVTYWYIRELQ